MQGRWGVRPSTLSPVASLELSIRFDWPAVFAATLPSLQRAFGDEAIGYDHIGSTSVPGLLGKPVLDVLVTVRHAALPPPVLCAMERAGFEYRGEFGVEHRHFFARPDCHVHGFREGEGEWGTHLVFRDYLRHCPEGREDYATFKRDLAVRVGWDRAAYQAQKDAFVTGFLPRAWEWAGRTGWQVPA